MSIPLLKLGGLALRTLAKPVSKRLKVEAGRREFLKHFCINAGQYSHQITSFINVAAAGMYVYIYIYMCVCIYICIY